MVKQHAYSILGGVLRMQRSSLEVWSRVGWRPFDKGQFRLASLTLRDRLINSGLSLQALINTCLNPFLNGIVECRTIHQLL